MLSLNKAHNIKDQKRGNQSYKSSKNPHWQGGHSHEEECDKGQGNTETIYINTEDNEGTANS